MTLDDEDLDTLRTAARRYLATASPVPPVEAEGAPDLDAGAAELGWPDLAADLRAVVVVAEELGRAACAWPLPERAALAHLAPAVPEAARVVQVDRRTQLAEAPTGATHALVDDGASLVLRAVAGLDPVPSTDLRRASLGDVVPHAGEGATARLVLQLGLVARAVGAARAAHELAVQHAVDRVQFGRPIGAFQAVSHRLADGAVELAGWDALRDLLAGPDPHVLLATAVQGRAAALRALGGAQRTLGAMGYFDEHPLPWLFRRAHRDLDRARSLGWAEHELGAAVLGGARLPGIDLGPEAAAAVADLVADLEELGIGAAPGLDDDAAAVAALGQRGWIAPGLPPELGGRGASVPAQMAVDLEVHRRQVPVRVTRGVAATLAGVLEWFGSETQRAELLPRLATGRLRAYLGYSEPDVGSDLASLRTRAEREGDEWVVHGTKMWGTGAHRADHVWLAARTDPTTTGRDGLTVFLAPLGGPGWSCTEHRALSGEVACTTVFDGFRIADRCRIGEVHGGWQVITAALAAERVVMAGLVGEVGRQLDLLLQRLRGHHRPPTDAVGELVARRRVAEALLEASARDLAGPGAMRHAATAKLVTSELAELVARRAHDLLGLEAAHGDFDLALRLAPMYVIGGGTADIQRNLVARALGLPRS